MLEKKKVSYKEEKEQTMESRSLYYKGHKFVLGLFILTLGILFLLQNLHVVDVGNVGSYWPVIFIYFGLLQFAHRTLSGAMWGLFLILLGVGLMSEQLFGVKINVVDFWPLILVLIGLSMVVKSLGLSHRRSHHHFVEEESSESYITTTAVLGGVRKLVFSKDFLGGELNAVMGGLQVDLREAEIRTEAVLHVFIVMGGVEILVPEGWKVKIDAVPLLGGASDSTKPPQPDQAKTLRIHGTVIMGGIEVKNYSDEDWARTSA